MFRFLEQLAREQVHKRTNIYQAFGPRGLADGSHEEGLMARMLLEATKQQGSFPFTQLGFVEHYKQSSHDRTRAIHNLRDCLNRACLEHEGELVMFKWFFHPRSKAINTLMRELVDEASREEYAGILTIVEGLYYRALSLYPDDAELLRSRLRQWFNHYQPDWANVITAEFFTAIKEALESAEKKTLLEGFKECSTFQEVFDEIKKSTSSCDEAYICNIKLATSRNNSNQPDKRTIPINHNRIEFDFWKG